MNSSSRNMNQTPKRQQDVIELLQKQIDYYFSKENLQNDIYLIHHMDDDYYVPIDLIQQFRRVQRLNATQEDIIHAVEKSQHVCLNEEKTKIKPNVHVYASKTTLIIRNMPEDSTEEDLRTLFDKDKSNIKSIQKELADTWFVTFTNEEDTAFYNQKLQGYKYHDHILKVRIKIENILKLLSSTTSQDHNDSKSNFTEHKFESTKQIPSYIPSNYPPFPVNSNQYPYSPSNYMNQLNNNQMLPYYYYYYQNGIDPTLYLPPYYHKTRGAKRTTPNHSTSTNLQPPSFIPQGTGNSHSNPHTTETLNQKESIPQKNDIQQPSFLFSHPAESYKLGYDRPFIKYTATEIYDIKIKDTSLPSSIQPGDHSEVLVEANQQLLERGRTVSFDEALSQGRPRILSIDNNDYLSLIHQLDQIEQEVENNNKTRARKQSRRYSKQGRSENNKHQSSTTNNNSGNKGQTKSKSGNRRYKNKQKKS